MLQSVIIIFLLGDELRMYTNRYKLPLTKRKASCDICGKKEHVADQLHRTLKN